MVKKTRLDMRTPLARFGFIQISGDEGGQILNISDTGLCFQTFAPLGNVKNLQFWFSLNLRDRIEANGQVAWFDAETKVGGLRFQNLTERAIKHIRAYATGAGKEGTCEKGSIFAAALAKHVPANASAESNQPQRESAISRKTGAADSPFYRPIDRSTQASPEPLIPVDSTDLISLQRHHAVTRKRLLIGFVLGVLSASSAGVMLVPYFVNRARTASPQPGTTVSSSEKQTVVQSAPNSVALANPETTKNPVPENSLRMAASHSYDAKLSRVNSAQSSTPFFSNNANDPVKTGSSHVLSSGSQMASKAVKTPQQLWTAVQAGDSNAAIVLADRYMRGDGVPANCVQARVLLLAASERNNPAAIKKLHELDKNGCS